VCASVLLSILLEAVQTYLPSRRPSVLDVLTNGAGASIGAFIASAYAQNKSRLQITDARPIEVGGLMLFGLWLLAQAAPQPIWLALDLPHLRVLIRAQRLSRKFSLPREFLLKPSVLPLQY
jgi:hypothetical protein